MLECDVVRAVPYEASECLPSGWWCARDTVEESFAVTVPCQDWSCVVCLGDDHDSVVAVSCGHIYHRHCISKWLRRGGTCPLCRSSVPKPPHPPMEFQLSSWQRLPSDAVANDECTERQAQLNEERRTRGPLSPKELEARRCRLSSRFGTSPDPRFFIEILPRDEDIGPEVIHERKR